MSLRDEIAIAIVESAGFDWFALSKRDQVGKYLRAADRILAIPALAEALADSRLFRQGMSITDLRNAVGAAPALGHSTQVRPSEE